MISGRTIGQAGKSLESPTPTLFRTLIDASLPLIIGHLFKAEDALQLAA